MEIVYGLGFLALFCVSAVGGVVLRRNLPEEHLSNENMDAVRLVTGLLVTFAALILSLQLSTARSAFDTESRDRSIYAAQLSALDQCLRNLGPGMEPARLHLRQYTAAVVASTWPDEPAPTVEGMPDVNQMALRGEDRSLSELVNAIGRAVDTFAPADGALQNVAERCRSGFGDVVRARWAVIEDTHMPSGGFFVAIISFWLVLVFLSFGLQIPRRRLTTIVLAIGVVSISSVIFVIVDLDLPYRGLFGISSSAMREALADMSR